MATTAAAPTTDGTQSGTCSRARARRASSQVEPEHGLTSDEAAERLERYGPNRFAEAKAEPRWHAFLRQYRDPMQIVLLAAGVISIYPVKQPGTGIVILLLTLLNAVLGLSQEGKAAAAVAALAKMMIVKARVRRDGALASSRLSSSCPATSSRSRPATSCPPTGACSRRRRWRSPRRR